MQTPPTRSWAGRIPNAIVDVGGLKSRSILLGMIILAATPIGNLGDASPRLREVFEQATVIAAEDTRRTAQLLRLLEIDNRPELIALHDHNENERSASLVERAASEDIVVVSDAGMPTVSDPGFTIVQHAAKAGVTVTVIPGPSAVVTALAVSGLPTDRFTFEGFVPRKSGERSRALRALAEEQRTMVFFETANRAPESLRAMAESFGPDRSAAVCRELTKMHEEVRRGTLAELVEWAAEGLRGELVVVVAGAPLTQISLEVAVEMLHTRLSFGAHLKEAAKEVSLKTGQSARTLYEAALTAKKGSAHD